MNRFLSQFWSTFIEHSILLFLFFGSAFIITKILFSDVSGYEYISSVLSFSIFLIVSILALYLTWYFLSNLGTSPTDANEEISSSEQPLQVDNLNSQLQLEIGTLKERISNLENQNKEIFTEKEFIKNYFIPTIGIIVTITFGSLALIGIIWAIAGKN